MGKKYLDASITMRLTTEEKKQLEEDAQMAALTVSQLIRRRAFGRPVVSQIEMVMVNELRRQGGLLKNNFETIKKAGATKDVVQLQEKALKELIALIEKIGKVAHVQKSSES